MCSGAHIWSFASCGSKGGRTTLSDTKCNKTPGGRHRSRRAWSSQTVRRPKQPSLSNRSCCCCNPLPKSKAVQAGAQVLASTFPSTWFESQKLHGAGCKTRWQHCFEGFTIQASASRCKSTCGIQVWNCSIQDHDLFRRFQKNPSL